MKESYHILSIIRGTTVDGPGFRTSIYLAGCTHKCPGCHNPQSWPFQTGDEMTLEEIMNIVKEEDFDVTLSGGDPLCSPAVVLPLVRALKADRRNIWLFTGYTWEEIINEPCNNINRDIPRLIDIVREVDVVVDGPFIELLKDPDLLFRGSSNQRLIDVSKSLEVGKVILYG